MPRCLTLLLCLCLASLARGAEPTTPQPATLPPKSMANAAMRNAERAVRDAEDALARAKAAAREQLVKDLAEARRAAMKAENLDDANAIDRMLRGVRDAARATAPTVNGGAASAPAPATPGVPAVAQPVDNAGAQKLARRLINTRWEWGPETSVFLRADGVVEEPGWTARGLDTRWAAFDERTAVFIIAKGRKHELAAVLRFADDFTHWTGTNFEGRPAANNRRLSK